MPLDVAVTPRTLTSTLHYLKRGAEKPASYRIEPPPGVPRWNGIDDPHEVTIEDARGRGRCAPDARARAYRAAWRFAHCGQRQRRSWRPVCRALGAQLAGNRHA